MKKLGAITIGQSPRTNVISEMLPYLGDVEVLQSGALDNLTLEEIEKLAPKEGDYILVSVLQNGQSVQVSERLIMDRLQNCINLLEAKGVSSIMLICTGAFPDTLTSNVPLIYPQQIIDNIVPHLTSKPKIGVVIPDQLQITQSSNKWKNAGLDSIVKAYSPYDNVSIGDLSCFLDNSIDLIVMDCIGYNEKMKAHLQQTTEKAVVLGRTLVARVLGEIL